MIREELAKEVNEIWELYVEKHGLGDEIDKNLRELKYSIIKNLTMPDVINRRELLVEFAKFIQKYKNKGLDYDCVEREVDAFLNQ